MTHTLNYSRSFLLVRKHLFESRKTYILLSLAIAAFLILWLGVSLTFTNPYLFSERAQVAYYFITLFLSGCLSSGVLFSDLGTKARAINYLLLPGSALEKFCCQLLFGVFIFFIGYSAIFYVVDTLVVFIANMKYDTHWQVIDLFHIDKYPNPFLDIQNTSMFHIYFPIQAMFMLSSIYFVKNSIFNGLVSLGLLWVVCTLFFVLMRMILPPGRFADGVDVYEIIDRSGVVKHVSVPAAISQAVAIFFMYLMTPGLWLVAYVRLAEKEL